MPSLLSTAWFSRPSWAKLRKFTFQNTGPLRDGELELIAPHARWTDAMMAAVEHPRTQRQSPELANVTRPQVLDYLAACSDGHQGGGWRGAQPSYHWWMRDHHHPELPIAGAIVLRIGDTDDLQMYYGHVGYHVYPPHRGRHFAERAVRLILPLAGHHGVEPVWITCNPDNWPSLRTCQRLGASLVQTVAVPADHPLRQRGEVAKCRFRIDHGEHAGTDLGCRRAS